MVHQVIAIDNNPYNISYLKAQLPSISNIEVFEKDFTQEEFWTELVDGVLFGFSLHYEPTPINALENAFKQLKPEGAIIVIEYMRKDPVPWVPFPLPIFKLTPLLKSIGFSQIETIFQDNHYYIVRGRKST